MVSIVIELSEAAFDLHCEVTPILFEASLLVA